MIDKFKKAITSENYANRVIEAYLSGKQSVQWVRGSLEFWSNTEELRNNPELRKQELLRVVNLYGKDRELAILNELRQHGLI